MKAAKILKELREDRGILLKELAAYLHCSISTVSNYESGVHKPDPDTLVKLALYYNVTTDYLLGLTKYPYRINALDQVIYGKYTVERFLALLSKLSREEKLFLIRLFAFLERTQTKDHIRRS